MTTGDNAYKQLGYQKEKGDREPGVVTALADRAVRKLACGDFFTIVATEGESKGGWTKECEGERVMEEDKDVCE